MNDDLQWELGRLKSMRRFADGGGVKGTALSAVAKAISGLASKVLPMDEASRMART